MAAARFDTPVLVAAPTPGTVLVGVGTVTVGLAGFEEPGVLMPGLVEMGVAACDAAVRTSASAGEALGSRSSSA